MLGSCSALCHRCRHCVNAMPAVGRLYSPLSTRAFSACSPPTRRPAQPHGIGSACTGPQFGMRRSDSWPYDATSKPARRSRGNTVCNGFTDVSLHAIEAPRMNCREQLPTEHAVVLRLLVGRGEPRLPRQRSRKSGTRAGPALLECNRNSVKPRMQFSGLFFGSEPVRNEIPHLVGGDRLGGDVLGSAGLRHEHHRLHRHGGDALRIDGGA